MTPEFDGKTTWNDISAHLPKGLVGNEPKMLRGYFRVQERLQAGQRVKATELMHYLQKVVGFEEFEKENDALFAAIDVAVRGSTKRQDGLNHFIEPLFKITR